MITLIATTHKEKGICNSSELYKIIERIAPEIIFEEIPPSKFAAVYGGTRHDSLETKTIKIYLQKHDNTAHLPVDLDTDDLVQKTIKKDFDAIIAIFKDYSLDYNDLLNQIGYLSEQFGFPYLNGDQCKKLLERKFFLEQDILRNLKEDATQKNMNHEKFSQAYKGWLSFIDRREDEMIKNIYGYSESHKYDRALFLVGAEHRRPIIDKIPKFEKHNQRELKWIFNFFS